MREPRAGLRLRLTVAICAVGLLVAAASFLALRETTSDELTDRVDQELRDQLADFETAVPPGAALTPEQVERRARRYLSSQRYRARARILAVEVGDRPPLTNEPRLLEREAEEHEDEEHGSQGEGLETAGDSGLLDAPLGLQTISGHETGELRALSAPIVTAAGRIGTFRAADPVASIDEAREGIDRAFVVVGLLALALSISVAAVIATVMTRPLRRIADVASSVGADDLDVRVGDLRRRDEIGLVGQTLDSMLDRLQRAFARQREFVSDASHELRTPLAVLRGQVDLLATERDVQRRAEITATVLRELDRMNRLVDDMLTLASGESGTALQRRQIDIAGFVEDLRRDLPLLGDRRYVVTGPDGGALDADADRLEQIIRNLVRNAVAVTEPDDRIAVALAARGDTLEVTVSDDGPGIPPDELARVFDRFHRAGAERHDGGTGLGLAIAQALVEAHGGTIGVDSPPGHGATFRFTIPGLRTEL
jgi:two-component system OmpR family sensor kinase